ncbi:MAG: phage tail tape measure protein, partial [Muribaculaceae bacterium]|nr:phage tail tape measure protein [Muribaculaceae bacterium]
ELAAAAYFAAHASIPFAGFGIASGFVSEATSIVENIGVMPFAEGGIVSGPTLGLVGEYAGARNNPEVIAPLDKLRAIIGPSDSGDGKVVFKIAGRTLVGILEKETNLRHRN